MATDALNGGGGIDTANYYDSELGVTISLITDVAFGGEADGDEFYSIENITGSTHADELWGDNVVNVLNGLAATTSSRGSAAPTSCSAESITTRSRAAMATTRSMANTARTSSTADTDNDVCYVDNVGDTIAETADAGADTVRAASSYQLTAGASVEALTTVNGASIGRDQSHRQQRRANHRRQCRPQRAQRLRRQRPAPGHGRQRHAHRRRRERQVPVQHHAECRVPTSTSSPT